MCILSIGVICICDPFKTYVNNSNQTQLKPISYYASQLINQYTNNEYYQI